MTGNGSPPIEEAPQVSDSVYRVALKALPAHTAVLDRSGTIILVNDAWTAFARANGGSSAVTAGANYLDICRQTAAEETQADQAFAGIHAVLDGSVPLFEMEYPCHSPREQRWFLMTVSPLSGQGGAIVSHANITARKKAEQALRRSEERFRATFDHAAVGIAHVAPEGQWLKANRRLCDIVGYSHEELLAKPFRDIIHTDDLDAYDAHLEVMRAGGSDACRIEQRLLRKDGSTVWVVKTLGCVRKQSGAIDYLVVGVEDVSVQKRVEERQQTLLRELSHRGKNLLAVIVSIAGRSLSGDRPLAEAREALLGRLMALSKNYEALTNGMFDGVLLDVVLRNELESFGGRVRLAGPSVMLTAQATQMIVLVTHELATNAAKYGALSVPGGQLAVSWGLAGEETQGRLTFDWREEGGPPVEVPVRRGFGSMLISQVAGAEFDCQPVLAYEEEGFHYRFEAPLDRLGAALSDTPVRRRLKNAIICALYDTWARQRPFGGLPHMKEFDWSKFAATGALTIANINDKGEVQFAQVGRALIERLGHSVEDIQGWMEEDAKNSRSSIGAARAAASLVTN